MNDAGPREAIDYLPNQEGGTWARKWYSIFARIFLLGSLILLALDLVLGLWAGIFLRLLPIDIDEPQVRPLYENALASITQIVGILLAGQIAFYGFSVTRRARSGASLRAFYSAQRRARHLLLVSTAYGVIVVILTLTVKRTLGDVNSKVMISEDAILLVTFMGMTWLTVLGCLRVRRFS